MHDTVRFENAAGATLVGVLHQPDTGHAHASAVFAHCFTCTKNLKAAVDIADALASAGIAVLRFDFTGLGQSGGDFEDTHFSSNVDDLVDAAAFMARRVMPPAVLVGHSLGGTATLSAAARIDSVRAVATIGAPAEAEHVLNLLGDDLEDIEKAGSAEVRLAGRPFRIRRDFVEDVRAQNVRDGIAGLRRALLLLHSPLDEVVPIDEASRIFASAMHPKSFVSLDRADHLLTDRADSRYAGQVIAAWAARYLEDREPAPEPARHVEGATVVHGRPGDVFLSAVNANGHAMLADEPEDYGGTDLGPTPYDFLAAALGSCTVMTLNMYARRKRLEVERVEAVVRHERIHAKDCADCTSKEGHVDRLTREIRIDGALDDDARARMLEIADRCPVHRTLHGEIRIVSRLAD